MKSVRLINLLTSLVIMLMIMAGNAQAALKAYGPTDPVTSLPAWYQDNNNLALVPCVDQNGFCILPPEFDPAFQNLPITTTGPINDNNFPGESFYYSAEAAMQIDGDEARLTFVIEAAFLAGVSPDSGIVFLRTDLVKMRGLTPNSTYRVTHPYGTFDFTTDAAGDTTGGGGVAVRLEDNAGVPAQWMPAGMKAGTITGIGPYLTRKTGGLIVDPISGNTYIGDAATPVEVVGSPTGNNFFRIERVLTNGVPVTGISWQTDLFVLMGRVFTGPIPSDLTVSATYARDAVDGQVDIFATAVPGAVLNISGTGITSSDLTADNPVTGKYFLNIPLSTPDLPSNLVITNSLDLQATPPHSINLVDEVNITEANYNQSTQVLTIKASSRDKVVPFPTLTAANFTAPGNSFDSYGVFTKTLSTIPPQTVTVTSSKGGSATAPVSVGVPDPLVITTAEALPDYAIDGLYNQPISASGGVPPYTWSSSVSGSLPPGINFFANTGRLFGTPTSFGSYSFSLQVADSLGAITIKPFTLTSSTPPNPVAVADSATTTAGSTIVINVLANDTSPVSSINPATVSVSAATGGSAVANLDGTVSYTAPATAGSYSFGYSVKDNSSPVLNSNETIVGVIVSTLPATGVIVTSSLASPQVTGTAVTFNAAGQGSSGYQYQFQLFNGTSWSVVQGFGIGSSWTLPANTPPGDYTLAVQVRTSSSVIMDAQSFVSYNISTVPPPPATGVIVTSSLASPQVTGTAVTFNAAGQGSSGYQYQFQLFNGTSWSVVQEFGIGSSWTLPANTPPGDYTLAVQVRTSSSVIMDAQSFVSYNISTVPPPPATGVIVTSSLASPQVTGTAVTFNAAGQGSSGYQYQFQLFNGTSWSVVQGFGIGSSWTLPANTPPGDYTLAVQVRTSSSVIMDAQSFVSYNISTVPPPPATGVIVTSSLASPQVTGTAVTFNAAGQGSSGYQYQFQLFNGTSWSVVQEFGIGSSWTLPANTPPGDYTLAVQVRTSSSVIMDAQSFVSYIVTL